jgi:predicted amidohydrolase
MTYALHVQTISWPRAGGGSVAANAAEARDIIDRSRRDIPLVLCFPEGFLDWGVKAPIEELQAAIDEALPGLCRAAKGIQGIVAIPALRTGAPGREVVTHLVDGAGTIAATYAKRFPWPAQPGLEKLEYDAVPGNGIALAQVGACRVGVQMCFDVNFPNGWEELAAAEADLILFPSAYPAGFGLRARAWDCEAMVAAAVLGDGPSPLIDSTGQIIAMRGSADNGVGAKLNCNRALVHLDHQRVRIERLHARYPQLRIARLERDNVALIEGAEEGPPVRALLAQEGIADRRTYLRRARKAIDARRDSRRAAE